MKYFGQYQILIIELKMCHSLKISLRNFPDVKSVLLIFLQFSTFIWYATSFGFIAQNGLVCACTTGLIFISLENIWEVFRIKFSFFSITFSAETGPLVIYIDYKNMYLHKLSNSKQYSRRIDHIQINYRIVLLRNKECKKKSLSFARAIMSSVHV